MSPFTPETQASLNPPSSCRSRRGSSFVPLVLQQSRTAGHQRRPAAPSETGSPRLIRDGAAAVSGAAVPADGPLFLWCHSRLQPGSAPNVCMPDSVK